MSEELKNETAAPTAEVSPVETKPETGVPAQPPTPEAAPAAQGAEPQKEEPQVVVQTERGFAHYVGFAMLFVLCLMFYFAPGIALTYAINMIPGVNLGGMAAWVLGAIFSVVIWLIFKLKIKGFKKSFYIYIALCVVVFAGLVAIQIASENSHLFANILAMLTGASN